MKQKKMTYASLFSSAGIGCYGFLLSKFKCISTVEIEKKRIDIQKINKKCEYDEQYICDDLTKLLTQKKLFSNIEKYSNNDLDILIATPPCQGMSVANQKKNKNDILRNSLVVTAIEMVNKISPKIFIFENVRSFLNTTCFGLDGKSKKILDEINDQLNDKYLFEYKILNFKNYGSNSSRTRTLIIGVRKDCLNIIAPYELFPKFRKEKKLINIIGKYKSLENMDDYDHENPLHHFKKYSPHMKKWIENLKQGESAMDNVDPYLRPHRIINGIFVENKKIFGDKWKRQYWDKCAPCIHTVNDCLAAQNTIHPKDNRAFTIAELMECMNIPKSFKWTSLDFKQMSKREILTWLNKNESNIRKCIGEAVPTIIFYEIAKKIRKIFDNKNESIIKKSLIFEEKNNTKKETGSYYTEKVHLSYISKDLPNFKNKRIKILEPSCGFGNFLEILFVKYQEYEHVDLYINDIDEKMIDFWKKNINPPKNFKLHYLNSNYIDLDLKDFNLIIGNPPFITYNNQNLVNLFWEKSIKFSENVIFINPKSFLINKKNLNTRNKLIDGLNKIIDYGETGFKNAKIETIAIFWKNKKNNLVEIESLPQKKNILQKKNYILDKELDYWLIYKDQLYEDVKNKLIRDVFIYHKNYEISNNKCSKEKNKKFNYRILKSKNINFFEPKINTIKNYDIYTKEEDLKKNKLFEYVKNNIDKSFYLFPNLTYYPRLYKLNYKNYFVNGSILILETKKKYIITDKTINYYYSNDFRHYYNVAFNCSTRTLNIDDFTIKILGILKDEVK